MTYFNIIYFGAFQKSDLQPAKKAALPKTTVLYILNVYFSGENEHVRSTEVAQRATTVRKRYRSNCRVENPGRDQVWTVSWHSQRFRQSYGRQENVLLTGGKVILLFFFLIYSLLCILYDNFSRAILLHKKSIHVTWPLQTIFNATFIIIIIIIIITITIIIIIIIIYLITVLFHQLKLFTTKKTVIFQ